MFRGGEPVAGLLRAGCHAVGLCIVLTFCTWTTASPADEVKRVLVLHSNESVLPATAVLDGAIRREMQSGPFARMEVFSEFLQRERFPDPEQEARMAAFLGEKYAGHPIDVVITTGSSALDFMVQHRESLHPAAPILFVGVNSGDVNVLHPPLGVFGVVNQLDPLPTVELALRLQPGARQLVVVAGETADERAREAEVRVKLRASEDRLTIRSLSGLPMAELLREVGQLPPEAFVLYLGTLRDGAGQSFIARDVAEKLAAAASVPVYGVYDTFLGHGIVGGYMNTFDALGRQVGRLGLGILAGTRPETIPLAAAATYVDWHELQRWGLSESRPPPGTVVRFREPSLWRQYEWQFALTAGLVITQSVLIAALTLQARRRRRAEDTSRDGEERISLAAAAANLGFWHWDPETDTVWAGETCRQMVGLNPRFDLSLSAFLGKVHPDDMAATRQSLEQARKTGNPYKAEWRMLRPGGADQWIRAIGRTRSDASGRPGRIVGVVIDVTQEKHAESELLHSRMELTHLTRVALLGELSGAIAHELNQPLTAILGNAQAALLLIGGGHCNMTEIRQILSDIAVDSKRAGEVIRNLQTLFTKGDRRACPVDVNQVVTDVLKITQSDLLVRKVSVLAQLAPDLHGVSGNRVQLQQVLLNLIVNACDAMAENEPGERGLTIVTENEPSGAAQLRMTDSGSGIATDMLDQLFKPFVSSKARGLGLGLSLCSSIIAAHGGRLWAVNNPDRGATFHLTLPADRGTLQ
jgi:PAS domain S-box-containing protein